VGGGNVQVAIWWKGVLRKPQEERLLLHDWDSSNMRKLKGKKRTELRYFDGVFVDRYERGREEEEQLTSFQAPSPSPSLSENVGQHSSLQTKSKKKKDPKGEGERRMGRYESLFSAHSKKNRISQGGLYIINYVGVV